MTRSRSTATLVRLMAALLCLPLAGAACDERAPGGAAGDGDQVPGVDGGDERGDPPADVAPGSPQAAVAVVRAYYDAIADGDYERAYALWADDGAASGQSLEQFRGGYARTASVEARIGEPGRIEGAAGSRYVTVPVTLEATLRDGTPQCFTGGYTLRRSEVTGATEAQRRWRIHSADLHACDPGDPPSPEDAAAARAVVRRFGERLAQVSLLAPPDRLREALREHYGPLVTPALLEAWLSEPASAPGREVSSPWPARIEPRETRRIDASDYRIAADVVYMTSVEAGTERDAHREPVVLRVVRQGDGWRIAGLEWANRPVD